MGEAPPPSLGLRIATRVGSALAIFWLSGATPSLPVQGAAIPVAQKPAATVRLDPHVLATPAPRPAIQPHANAGIDIETEAEAELEEDDDTIEYLVRVERGDTLLELLIVSGVAKAEAFEAVEAIKRIYSPRQLKVGTHIELKFAPGQSGAKRREFQSALLPDNQDRDVLVERSVSGAFLARFVPRETRREMRAVEGVIETSLYEATGALGLPQRLVAEFIRAFSYDVDFQRELQPGDRFEIMFEAVLDTNNRIVRADEFAYAALNLSGRRFALWRFTGSNGITDYFNENGRSARKAFLRTPLDGARVSSRFGSRQHPILGFNAIHRGIDFAAYTGTPVYAAGDGEVEVIGRNGGYGNYVRIRHNRSTASAYAHLSRYAAGLQPGSRVRQGQVIGYVGSTGQSTGPHLHYEVIVAGRQINPLSIKSADAEPLSGRELQAFMAARSATDKQYSSLVDTPNFARLGAPAEVEITCPAAAWKASAIVAAAC
jgi:murein DD-endopeptidase MepM/ murein hydrolase activator NlpD